MKYYKVIYSKNKKLVSPVANGKGKVIYSTKRFVSAPKWLKDKGYNLLVFTNLEQAKRMSFGCPEWNIYEVNVRGVLNRLPKVCNLFSLSNGELRSVVIFKWMPYSVMAKKVKLKKLIKI